jgi:hypothetical protein
MKESQNENKEVKDKQKSNTKRKREPSKRKNNKEETATNSKPAAATTRKKRRTTEDILHEEAREHVFKGNDPKDVDRLVTRGCPAGPGLKLKNIGRPF